MYKNIAFLSGSVKYRYDPSIDCGDIVYVEGNEGDYFKVIVLGHKISMTGGLSATVECNINTATAKEFVSTPSSKKLTSKFNDFIAKYQDIVKVLTSVSGGYVKEVRDSSEKVRALAITQSDIEVEWDETNNKVVVVHSYDSSVPMWVWSYGGLSFSNNGGASYEVAINMRGEIYAEQLIGKLGKVVELETEKGTIAGWNITEDALYKDFGDYRAFIQSPKIGTKWVFSVQKKSNTDENTYYGGWFVTADGKMYCYNEVYFNDFIRGNKLQFVTNYGDNSSRTIIFQTQPYSVNGNNPILPYITASNSDLLIRTDNGKALYLDGDGGVYIESELIIDHNIRANYELNANGGINVNNGYSIVFSNGSHISPSDASYKHLSIDGVECLDLYGSSYIQAHNDLRLDFKAVSGTIPLVVNTSGVITVTSSSERYKENVIDELSEDLNPHNLYKLPVVQYNYKNEFKDKELVEGTQIGVTAEDVHKCYPNACIYNEKGEPESWQDRIMIPAMLKLIQEQKVQLDEQASEIDNLKARLSALEDIVNKLTKE